MKRYIFIILFIFPFLGYGQIFSLKRGVPFIKNYSQSDYNAHEQNFDIVQDTMGVMYFANFEAVLVFDGSHWSKIPTKSGMRVLALDVCYNGTVFVGGLYDFGLLEKNIYGEYSYISLVDTTFGADYVGEIFDVEAIGDAVYFISKNRMFVYENNQVRIEEFDVQAVSAYESNEELYVFFTLDLGNQSFLYNGLTKYKNNTFVKIADNTTEKLAGVVTSFYLSNNSYVIGTENQGFFVQTNDTINDFNVPVNDLVKKNTLTCGVKINNDLYAIGTLTQGVLFVNSMGDIVQIVNKQSSLKDEAVNAVFLDHSKNLWVATNNGVSLIEINNALSGIYNDNSGVDGKINKIIEFNSTLFLATDYGLYKYQNNSFIKISNFEIACWDMIADDNNRLLLATPQGVFIYQNGTIKSTDIIEFSFCISENDKNFFVGQNLKVLVIDKQPNTFKISDTIKGLDGNVIALISTNDFVYAEVPAGKIYKIGLTSTLQSELKTGSGFISVHLNTFKNNIFFSSEKGSFTEKNGVDTIVPFNFIAGNNKSSKIWLYELFEINDNLYVFTDGSRKNVSFLNILPDGYNIRQNELLPISDFVVRTWYLMKDQNNLLLGGNDGIVMYDYKTEYLHNHDFGVFFTSISTVKTDSLISLQSVDVQKFKFTDNSLLFKYTAPYYSAKGTVYYRYYLAGFEEDTSEWTLQNFKEYTNLPSGNYKFYVQAKDQFGNNAKAVSFEFKVLVPIARRWWMIVIYILIAAIIVKLFVDWRIKIAEKEKVQLEEIIKERTEEIEKSKAEIEAQRDIEYSQRKEIMASIHYARRIQQAVLPDQKILTNALNNNYFIFFRPYEVVSGDFFWMKELKNFVAIVAADCTGHGVPGAFMSMLGTSFLNEIVTRRSLDSAAEVLERLRQKVKTSLHQEGKMNEQKDGMDISMYFIDKETLNLQYAGAYNPLYVVRKTKDVTPEVRALNENTKRYRIFEDDQADFNYTLIELKANRQPIGIHVRELPFENTSFQLYEHDCLYSFSDGYQDQFGGDTGEKFNSKRFKKLLLSIQEKDMKEQHRILDQNFIKWKGDLHQVDDVLVIGVKIDF
ncbi:MAG: SpoIIE family protein phosphatase [Bacteroidales bacterium]|nr:SpoIIE family protein phosphatase [Bacteroidales bacterium]